MPPKWSVSAVIYITNPECKVEPPSIQSQISATVGHPEAKPKLAMTFLTRHVSCLHMPSWLA